MATPPPSSATIGRWLWPALGVAALAAAALAREAPAALAAAMLAAGACGALAWSERRPVAKPERADPAPAAQALVELAPLLEALPDAALLVAADGRIAGSNSAARKQLAFEAAGLRLSAILRQPDLLDAVHAAVHDAASRTVEYETAGPVDSHVRAYVAPVQWGDAPAALIAFHDETSRINTERMRADFLANASHELRTPLSALMLLMETIGGPARDNVEDRTRFLAMMQVQAERMRRLIDDLLSLSRIELDEHVPPTDRADLAAVAREVVDALTSLAGERGVRLTVEGEARVEVVGLRFQLLQVIQNLVDNAIKYSSRGGAVIIEVGTAMSREEVIERAGRRWPDAGRIALATPPPAGGRAYAYVRVVDAGPGIARRFLPRLGARFFRVEREMGDERGGTGLGLALVKHIVNRHRGGLLVESEPGRGSAFAAYLEHIPADAPVSAKVSP
jgi:two-component system phosphate regulon sensor histidine kinase PhoR